MTKNENFFHSKRPWSKIKDMLLSHYLKPYFMKIFHAGSILYVDCFAGQGKFEDNQKGSPLIVLDVLQQCVSTSKLSKTPQFKIVLIEPKYSDTLSANINSHSLFNRTHIINGDFQKEIIPLVKCENAKNLFLYIDPFGIKELSFKLFEEIIIENNSLEMLINLNSFGFLREACRVMSMPQKFTVELETFLDPDSISDNFVQDIKEQDYIDRLNDIAGGNYWNDILKRYQTKEITAIKAEQEFSAKYRERLNQNFKYVIDVPIRDKKNNRPKYRIVHATNHPDGCMLMYENICNKWEAISLMQSGGQLSLLTPKHIEIKMSADEIKQRCLAHIQTLSTDNKTSINEIYASFCTKEGVLCSFKELTEILVCLEQEQKIFFTREPQYTKTGQLSKFMKSTSKQKVWLK